MSFLHLSFASGIVRPMLATRTRPSSTFGRFDAEAVARCTNMRQAATVLDKETLAVIGRVELTNLGYAYIPAPTPETPA